MGRVSYPLCYRSQVGTILGSDAAARVRTADIHGLLPQSSIQPCAALLVVFGEHFFKKRATIDKCDRQAQSETNPEREQDTHTEIEWMTRIHVRNGVGTCRNFKALGI